MIQWKLGRYHKIIKTNANKKGILKELYKTSWVATTWETWWDTFKAFQFHIDISLEPCHIRVRTTSSTKRDQSEIENTPYELQILFFPIGTGTVFVGKSSPILFGLRSIGKYLQSTSNQVHLRRYEVNGSKDQCWALWAMRSHKTTKSITLIEVRYVYPV